MRVFLVCSVALLLLGGCTTDSASGPGEKRLRVLAAASLTGSFDALARRFEAAHQGVTVETVYDSSVTLAQQVTEGAPADVLATADLETIRTVLAAGDAGEYGTFAGNTAVLVTPEDNPADITSFADLDRGDPSFVVCVDAAPCGRLAAALLARNRIGTAPRSFEDNVRAVLQKVVSGEADAGIVYATDARAAGDRVTVVEIPGAAERVTGYGIAVLEQSQDAALAQAFVDLVLSAEGRRILRDAGFGPAP